MREASSTSEGKRHVGEVWIGEKKPKNRQVLLVRGEEKNAQANTGSELLTTRGEKERSHEWKRRVTKEKL